MSIETTLQNVELDIAAGNYDKARDRLLGLISTYPNELSLRRKLGDIYCFNTVVKAMDFSPRLLVRVSRSERYWQSSTDVAWCDNGVSNYGARHTSWLSSTLR
jgi:hypothetical protein